MDLPGSRVLVADDDPCIRRLLVVFLSRQGFRPIEARDGRETLAEMRAGNADLVIMDLAMPGFSGMAVLRERAADPRLRRIPVIVVTAASRRGPADFVDEQAGAIVAKPFDLDELLSVVRTCLEEEPDVPHPAAA